MRKPTLKRRNKRSPATKTRRYSIRLEGKSARVNVLAEIFGETIDEGEIADLARKAAADALMKAKELPGPRAEPQPLERFFK